MKTTLTAIRKPSKKEKTETGAEIIFEREDEAGRTYTIYGCESYEGWQQWGESKDILGDNVSAIENWRKRCQIF